MHCKWHYVTFLLPTKQNELRHLLVCRLHSIYHRYTICEMMILEVQLLYHNCAQLGDVATILQLYANCVFFAVLLQIDFRLDEKIWRTILANWLMRTYVKCVHAKCQKYHSTCNQMVGDWIQHSFSFSVPALQWCAFRGNSVCNSGGQSMLQSHFTFMPILSVFQQRIFFDQFSLG